ncbi:hypothetical protein HA402_003855 [Bradysia odoriphaga]|nr:hypothetical protein HA402_003855 [Bradysia odoriphaga]
MYLPKPEIAVYLIVYVLFLLYGIYQIYMLSDVISSKSKYIGFTNGWKLLGRKRDDLDFEWESWKYFVWDNCLWFSFHLILTETLRWIAPKFVSRAHMGIGACFLLVHFNLKVLTILLAKTFSFILLMHFKRKRVVWLCATFWLLVIILFKYWEQHDKIGKLLDLNESQCYELVIILSWNVLKSISFSVDYISNKDKQTTDAFGLINIYGYVLYFPNLLLGPFIIFGRYNGMMNNAPMWNVKNAIARLIRLIVDLSRACFWLLFTDFALHFIYLGNLQHNTDVVKILNPWSLYTFGYLMGQFFHNKYVVFYGLPMAVARYENIDAPGLPKCIGRIHLYSNMWKYFDQGLYEFLFYYIYTSLCQKTSSVYRKVFASFVTFAFIYLWHGVYQFVFIWAMMNFVCLQLEQLGRYMSRTQRDRFERHFSESNRNRIKALLGTQIFIPAVISNFYFFAGVDVGNVFVKRTYFTGNCGTYVSLSFCSYCIYHVSEVIERLGS